ncbi:MAG: hypothetical protein QM759_14930 [Terricaulis sp.]
MAKDLKCPKCSKNISELNIETIKSSLKGQDRQFPTVVFSCPSCGSVLGAQIDPVSVMSGTVKGVAKALTQRAPAKKPS